MHREEAILAPKEEPRDDVDQTHAEEYRVEAPTHAETSIDGRKRTREADRLMHEARDNMGSPTS